MVSLRLSFELVDRRISEQRRQSRGVAQARVSVCEQLRAPSLPFAKLQRGSRDILEYEIA